MSGHCIHRTPRSQGFKVLGVSLSFDNSFEVELQNRIARAWRAFYKYAHLLRCRTAPVSVRLKLLTNLVSSSLFWCAGSWNLTARQRSKLRGVQQDMLQKMITLRRLPDEDSQTFMSRLRHKIKRLKALSGFIDWDRLACRLRLNWAGHLARMGQYDTNRLSYRMLQYRSGDWIRKISSNNAGNQLHGRHLKVWRWEWPLCKFFGKSSWQTVANDKDSWNQQLDSIVDRMCHR